MQKLLQSLLTVINAEIDAEDGKKAYPKNLQFYSSEGHRKRYHESWDELFTDASQESMGVWGVCLFEHSLTSLSVVALAARITKWRPCTNHRYP